MDDKWEVLYTSSNLQHVMILKGMLENEGIKAIELNQKDSMYQWFGDIKLYVLRTDYIPAKRILNQFLHE